MSFASVAFHWGLHGWAAYAVVGLAIAFFTYNRGLPLALRSAFYPLLGERVWGWPGHVIDTLAVFATLFGLAPSLGLGTEQVTARAQLPLRYSRHQYHQSRSDYVDYRCCYGFRPQRY